MTPVVVLSDGFVANGAEPWRIPDLSELPKIPITHATAPENGEPFYPYARDEHLARPWAIPGTPGLMHRIGGLEKQDLTGNVSYDPDNHQKMIELRQRKVDLVAEDIPLQEVDGPEEGDLLIVSWGGTFGACTTAVRECREDGLSVSHVHLRYVNPFPRNLGQIVTQFDRVLVPELNMGQLRMLLDSRYGIQCEGLNKVKGKPFAVREIVTAAKKTLSVASV